MRTNRERQSDGADRGQAFTLEGIVSAIIVLTALWYALQAVIITPTTGGSVDPGVRAELQQQAEDALTIAGQAESDTLSELVRNWSQSQRTFFGAVNPRIGYGDRQLPGTLGVILNDTFDTRSRMYNVEMRFLSPDPSSGTETVVIASRGTPSESAVTASYRVTLYDNMTLTAPTAPSARLKQYDTNPTANPEPGKSGYYPIPNAVKGPVYNVVEIRVVVW